MNKKTEVLKCRIDSATFLALQALCNETGQTVSESLRMIIGRELAGRQKGANARPAEVDWSASHRSKQERAECARVLSLIMVGPQPTLAPGGTLEDWRVKQRKVSSILESLLSVMENSRSMGKTRDRTPLGHQQEYHSFAVSQPSIEGAEGDGESLSSFPD